MSCVDAPDLPGAPPDFRGNLRKKIPRLRVDRHHVPAAQAPRQLAVLRLQRHAARLRGRRRDQLQADPAGREDAGHLEPASLVLTVRENGSSATSRRSATSSGARRREAAGRVVDRADAEGQRASARARVGGPGVRHDARERDHAEPELELDRDLPHLGRLGRLLRPRRAAGVDANGYGLRVPGLVISPYAKRGYIDHQTLSFDAYLKFIEDDFLEASGSTRRPTAGPTAAVRARRQPLLGDLARRLRFHADAAAAAPARPVSGNAARKS